MTPQEQQAFDAMREALENIAGDKWPDPEMTAEEYAREALSAAKAVGEPTIKESFTVAEQSAELDAGMAAQHYCRGLWGAARGHSDWRKVHEHFANGYKQGCYDNEMANGPNPWPDEHHQASEPAWMPIETAPKDGQTIVVGYGRQSGFPVKVVRFNTIHKHWSNYGEAEVGLETNATHWMPLPAAPEATK